MKRAVLVALLVAAMALCAAAAAPAQQHHFETPKGTVVVTVQHGKPAAPAEQAAPAAEESSEESSAEAPASEESSSEASEESSSEASKPVSTADLEHFTLPPEPAAAKGYKPLGCPNDKGPCEQQEEEQQQEAGPAPCTENCEAVETAENQAGGKVVLSQPLGVEAATDGNYVPAVGSRTGGSVDTSSWVVAPQTGIQSGTAMPSALPSNGPSALPSVTAAPAPSACGCDVCPCGEKFVTPAERRAQRMAQLEAQEKAQRAQEKGKLHQVMQAHQANLAKIEAMSRSLRWQYTQLRRQHQLLRAHISANKAAYNEMGGDNEYKGTDLDIETTPNAYETLDDIPAGGDVHADAHGVKTVHDKVKLHHDDQTAMLKGMHAQQQDAIKDLVGAAAAGKGKPAAAAGKKAADDAIAEAEAAKF